MKPFTAALFMRCAARFVLLCAAVFGLLPAAHASAPPLAFDHLYIHLSPATMRAVERHPALQELAANETRHVIADGGKSEWSGRYIYGRSTYIQLFPGGGDDNAVGFFGLGFSTSSEKRLGAVAARFRTLLKREPIVQERTIRTSGGDIPWISLVRQINASQIGELSSLWAMRLKPEFIADQTESTAAIHNDARRALLQTRYDPKKMMRDITAVHLRLPEAERTRLLRDFDAFGWRIRRAGDVWTAFGSGTKVMLSPATAAQRSLTLELALNRRVRAATTAVGDTMLVFNGSRSARWVFPAADVR